VTQKTVLILDDDLGFSMWLGRALNEAGFRTLPVSRGVEALAIIADSSFPQIDLVIANLKVNGCGQVLGTLAAQGRSYKVISIGAACKRAVDGKLRRPRGKTLPSPERYISTVRDVLGC
jgi:ActR/RegA family two-component response regulator